MIRRRIRIHGQVQGVFFRDTCKREALALGLNGSAENLEDGSVEVVLEGDPGAIEQMVTWCHHGPPHADVKSLDLYEEEPTGMSGFTIGGRESVALPGVEQPE